VAPTEHVQWRGGMLRGQVHDENAWALAGYGLAGHAGLFGTAAGVARLGCAVIESIADKPAGIPAFAARFCTSVRRGGTLRAGFDGKSMVNSSAGTLLGPHSFGHLGFTGTSLWCDPARSLVIALLTNRVCPSRTNTRLVAARGLLHDCLVRAADTVTR
jgi:CubicO group peptidase (beta-lactamase class C family)